MRTAPFFIFALPLERSATCDGPPVVQLSSLSATAEIPLIFIPIQSVAA
jgi:hypothetical protein